MESFIVAGKYFGSHVTSAHNPGARLVTWPYPNRRWVDKSSRSWTRKRGRQDGWALKLSTTYGRDLLYYINHYSSSWKFELLKFCIISQNTKCKFSIHPGHSFFPKLISELVWASSSLTQPPTTTFLPNPFHSASMKLPISRGTTFSILVALTFSWLPNTSQLSPSQPGPPMLSQHPPFTWTLMLLQKPGNQTTFLGTQWSNFLTFHQPKAN